MQSVQVVWAPSPNFSARNPGERVDLIVVHVGKTSYANSVSWFQRRASQVSAHYVLREDGAETTLMVDLDKKAWHAKALNSRSVGIEMASTFAAVSDEQWEGCARLTAALCTRYGIPAEWARDGKSPGICGRDGAEMSPRWASFIHRVGQLMDAGDSLSIDKPVDAIQGRRKVGYGWRRDAPRFKQMMRLGQPTKGLLDKYDLRRGFDPCYNQTSTSSCVGQSTAAAFRYVRRAEKFEDWPASRLFIYWCARALGGDTNEDNGAQIHDAFVELVKRGACPEKLWPFKEDAVLQRPPQVAWDAAKRYRALTHEHVPQTINAVKTAFAANVPVVFGFTAYESFESDAVAASGYLPVPKHDDVPVGGHAVVAVGCDDTKKLLTVRNSWGTDWGDEGYFYMPYAYAFDVNLATDFQLIRKTTA